MTVSPQDIRFIFYLPNLHSYLDRVDLIQRLAEKVGRGVLVTLRADAEIRGLRPGKLELVVVPGGKRFPGRSAIAASRTVGRLLRENDFNVVHDTFGHLSPLFWRRRRHPGQVFLTSFFSLCEWDLRRWVWPIYGMRTITNLNLRQWIYRTVSQRVVARVSDSVVVQAPGLVDRVSEINRDARPKLTWIPNNVVADSEHASQSDAAGGAEIKLLTVGGFGIAKGADELLTLLGRGKERGVPIRATVVGSSSPLDESIRPHIDDLHLRRRINSEGLRDHIQFLSRVEPTEMDRHYRSADWLFHPTRLDGSPRAVLEALARGLPVIGSRHPGVTVLDPEDGYILFSDPFDADAVLDQIEAEKSDPASHALRSRSGSEYVLKNFSSEAVSDRYVDLYLRLLSERVR